MWSGNVTLTFEESSRWGHGAIWGKNVLGRRESLSGVNYESIRQNQSEGGGEWQEGNSERNRDKSFQVL